MSDRINTIVVYPWIQRHVVNITDLLLVRLDSRVVRHSFAPKESVSVKRSYLRVPGTAGSQDGSFSADSNPLPQILRLPGLLDALVLFESTLINLPHRHIVVHTVMNVLVRKACWACMVETPFEFVDSVS